MLRSVIVQYNKLPIQTPSLDIHILNSICYDKLLCCASGNLVERLSGCWPWPSVSCTDRIYFALSNLCRSNVFFFFRVGWRSSPLGTSATNLTIVATPDDEWWVWNIEHWGVESIPGPLGTAVTTGLLYLPWVIVRMEKLVEWTVFAGETEVLGENLPHCPTQILHDTTWAGTGVSVVGNRRLMAWTRSSVTWRLLRKCRQLAFHVILCLRKK
jgi:hypothetical protein